MSLAVDLQLTHVGLFVWNIETMSRFYCDLLGLFETDRGIAMKTHDVRFLSRDPREHHQLVLASGRPPDAVFSIVNQLSFKVAGLAEMKVMHQRLEAADVKILRAVTHGNAWSMYFSDPEGNNVEVYTPSAWYVPQPFAHPADFTKSVEQLVAETEDILSRSTGVIPRAEWSEAFARRISSTKSSNQYD